LPILGHAATLPLTARPFLEEKPLLYLAGQRRFFCADWQSGEMLKLLNTEPFLLPIAFLSF
jgi:hypothetical protein